MTIFKANDIRGIYDEELFEQDAYQIARAFAQLVGKEVVIGQDMRLSSPLLAEACIRGLVDSGVKVIDIGIVDTPGLYFATAHLKMPGIMVTASHNPSSYNGFYLCRKNAEIINEESGLKKIEELSKKEFRDKKKGSVKKYDILPRYIEHILSFVKKEDIKRMRIVVDAGNGMGGWIASRVFSHFPQIEIVPMNFELDGSFPKHVPNPAVYDNMKDLAENVRKYRANFGIAFDGDADRAGFVDEKGNIIEGSIVGACLAQHILRKKAGKVVYSSTCSRSLPEAVVWTGGKPIVEKVGHSFIKSRMRKEKALFGAENTGHFFYKDNFYADSGIITALVIAEAYTKSGKLFSDMMHENMHYYKMEDINFYTANPVKAFQEFKRLMKKAKPEKTKNFDGLHLDFGTFWFSLRMSQTEPMIRLNIEAKTKDLAERKAFEISQIVKEAIKLAL